MCAPSGCLEHQCFCTFVQIDYNYNIHNHHSMSNDDGSNRNTYRTHTKTLKLIHKGNVCAWEDLTTLTGRTSLRDSRQKSMAYRRYSPAKEQRRDPEADGRRRERHCRPDAQTPHSPREKGNSSKGKILSTQSGVNSYTIGTHSARLSTEPSSRAPCGLPVWNTMSPGLT